MDVGEYALRHGFASTLPEGLRGASTSANNVAVIWEENMAHVLGHKGIPNRVDSWGPHWDHDWPLWRAMLPGYLHDLA